MGVNQDAKQRYRLIDKYNGVVSNTSSKNKKLIFELPKNIPSSGCYMVADDKGSSLFGKNKGVKITLPYEYNKKTKERKVLERQYTTCSKNKNYLSKNLIDAERQMEANKLFNGSTCDMPKQRPIPAFPKTICGSYSQCEKLANDSCTKDLIAAESCGAALSQTNVHGSITTVGCGVLLSSLNGENYGIASGVQDAITGYLDEHTKNMIQTGEYSKAVFSGLTRLAITYFRTESCKKSFTKAAYSPIEQWIDEKTSIQREPAIKKGQCDSLIRNFNQTYRQYTDNQSCVNDNDQKLRLLSADISKIETLSLEAELCAL